MEAALTVAASAASRGPFQRPMHARDEADAAIRALGGEDAYSDHAVLVAAFSGWCEARREGRERERAWCDVNFVSGRTMQSIDKTREQLRGTLGETGGNGGEQGGGRGNGWNRGNVERRLVILYIIQCVVRIIYHTDTMVHEMLHRWRWYHW